MTVTLPSRRMLSVGLVAVVTVLAVLAILTAGSLASDDGVDVGASGQAGDRAALRSGGPEAGTEVGAEVGADPSPASLKPVPVRPVQTLPPVPMTKRADFGTGVSIVVTGAEVVVGEARGPGEVAGPAVRLSVELRNSSSEPISLEHVVVNLEHGRARTPASLLSGPPTRGFEGVLEPSSTQEATYVFAAPPADHGDLRILVSYSGEAPTVALVGAVR